MDKVQAAFLGKTYDSFYNKQSTYEENRVNAAGLLRGDGFGPRDEEDDLDKPGILPDKKLSKNVKSKNRKSSKRGRGRKSLKGVKGFNVIFGIKAKRKNGSRQATSGDIRRAGISALKRTNASLARFIAARYSAKAIAKYQDYAGRLRRSKRLQKLIRKINDAFYAIKGYYIYTSTDGLTPYSCTCPDFSQIGDDRNWLGSKAGPFNPCKHMMAVRDAKRGCTDPDATNYDRKAIIDDGTCEYGIGGCTDPLADNYDPSATYDDGSCIYKRDECFVFIYSFQASTSSGFAPPVRYSATERVLGTISWRTIFSSFGGLQVVVYDDAYPFTFFYIQSLGFNELGFRGCAIIGNLYPCGSSGCTDPLALNYDPIATIDDGSCTY